MARQAVAVLEPVCCTGWLSDEGQANLAALGITERFAGYCATRGAPMGRVEPEVVAAAFYNFNPEVVIRNTALAWAASTPEAVIAGERAAADASLQAVVAAMPAPAIRELADLLRTAADRAATRVEGCPIASGVAAMDFPTEPHLVVWHAHHLLREHRGDAHAASLLIAGLSGIEALVVDCARTGFPAAHMRAGRFWSEDAWAEAAEGLRSRGWLTADDRFTDEGRERRALVEQQTDDVAALAFRDLGDERTARIVELGTPFGELAAPLALTKPRRRLQADGS
ncbi:MAG: hypothetical protein AB7H43_08320 [Acidimicrobiia bacterium]